MRRTVTLSVALLFCCDAVHNQPGPDWVRHVIADGFTTQTVVAADFTGDGRLDVITGDITPGQQRTLLYVAPDWKPVVLYQGIRTIYGVAMDVNGDGNPISSLRATIRAWCTGWSIRKIRFTIRGLITLWTMPPKVEWTVFTGSGQEMWTAMASRI